jgi:diguanylate cyclase (GGDEF)-like protein
LGPGGGIEGAVEIFERLNEGGPIHRMHGLDQYGCLDLLTGVGGRAYTEMKIAQCFAEMEAWGVPFGMLRVDIDRFSDFNHRYGEAGGDALLRVLAQTISKGLRSDDILGRWAGDEFLVLIRACPLGEVRCVGERLRALVALSAAPWWGDWIHVTVSVGGAVAHPGDSPMEVEARAGEQLGCSQAAGGDAVNVLEG